MKIRTFAGLLCIAGGLALVAIWVFFISNVLEQAHQNLGNLIDRIVSFLTGGDTLEFFIKSSLCVFGCFLSGALIISGKFSKLGIMIVIGNSAAVSIMYAWFIAALIASPLLFSYWVVKNA